VKKIVVMIGVFFSINLQADSLNFSNYIEPIFQAPTEKNPYVLSFLDYISATLLQSNGWTYTPQWLPTDQDRAQAAIICSNLSPEINARLVISKKNYRYREAERAQIMLRQHPKNPPPPPWPAFSKKYFLGASCEYLTSWALPCNRNAAYFAEKALHKIKLVHTTGPAEVALQGLLTKAVSMRQGFIDASTAVNKLVILYLAPESRTYSPEMSSFLLSLDWPTQARFVIPYDTIFKIIKEIIDTKVKDKVKKAGADFNIKIEEQLVTLLDNQLKILTGLATNGIESYKVLKCQASYKWGGPRNIVRQPVQGDVCNKNIGALTSITNQLFNTVIDQVNKVLQSMQK
jgi:hypothetical protein